MNFKRCIRFVAICLALTSCSSPEHSESLSEKSEEDVFVPYAIRTNDKITEYGDWGEEFLGEKSLYFGLAFINNEGNSTIVNYNPDEGAGLGFTRDIASSSYNQLRIGTVKGIYICDSESHFEIIAKRTYMLIGLTKEFSSNPQEYFFDLIRVESGNITMTSSLVLYPFARVENAEIPYKWRIDEIGGYSFPKVDGEYQPVTESNTKPFFDIIKKEAEGKYMVK